jgi:ribonucleoside-diphosphate reductase alpha chain
VTPGASTTPTSASRDKRPGRDAEPTRRKASKYWYERFLWALRRGAIPAGRITSNAGALEHKPATSTINCTVSGTITDSMDDILDKVHEAGLTLKAGCGIGYEFSTLRPRGAFVAGAGAYTSGPMSFMDIYDKMCFTVSSRRRPPRRADGHVRRLASGREGLHPRQARGRPPAPVQPVAADHR